MYFVVNLYTDISILTRAVSADELWPFLSLFVFSVCVFVCFPHTHTQTHTHTFSGFSQGEPRIASCPHPPIFLLPLFLDCASSQKRPRLYVSSVTQCCRVFLRRLFCLDSSTSTRYSLLFFRLAFCVFSVWCC